jgi:hypothetical protein
MYETYISDDYNEGCVIFPLEGEPVLITWAHLRVMRARWSKERGNVLWVSDYRVATSGTAVAEVFREKHLAEGRIGVVGLASQAPTEIYGAIPANFWLGFTTALPKARCEDISEEFSHMMLVKSNEEMAHTLSWGPPRWTTSGEAPRVLARGDLMQAELMPLCGNQVPWTRRT